MDRSTVKGGTTTGLIGPTERATLAGGTPTHGTIPDGGFEVRAALPWERPAPS
ncbi:hypothetical protein [Streptomyces tropicalis]|uniref:Uncharacterized protein n=1 Tax=Streptomyces tropicalis TaxID=3034234 RepID=A0ABT6A2D2_9ACTN|nr:hypothetical protein [Streptomyces tropicalis]MDF3298627.1 hypothetical protein [Streptomyces tropicalis]